MKFGLMQGAIGIALGDCLPEGLGDLGSRLYMGLQSSLIAIKRLSCLSLQAQRSGAWTRWTPPPSNSDYKG